MIPSMSDDIDDKIDCTPFTWRMALQQGIGNDIYLPTALQHDCIVRQAHALDPVYRLLGGFTVTSWLRSPDHNKSVGGAPSSMHLTGLATDFTHATLTPDECRSKIKQSGIYPGRTELDATTWVHLDLKNQLDFYARTHR